VRYIDLIDGMAIRSGREPGKMESRIIRMSGNGRITIPVEIRRALRFKQGDVFTVERDGNHIVLQRAKEPVDLTSRVVAEHSLAVSRTPVEEREAFAKGVAEEGAASLAIEATDSMND